MARNTQDSLREQSRQMDCLYNETDRLYNGFARSCGLSECAYWVMYEIEVSSGSASLRGMAEAFSLSKQTLSSAVKSLEAKGLIELSFEEGSQGSRKNKVASFTEAGRAFSRERIVPAIEAESRAFGSLEPEERERLVALVSKYARAIRRELDALKEGEK